MECEQIVGKKVDEPPITECPTHHTGFFRLPVCAYKQVGPTYSNTAIKTSVDIFNIHWRRSSSAIFVCFCLYQHRPTTRPPRYRKKIPANVPTNRTFNRTANCISISPGNPIVSRITFPPCGESHGTLFCIFLWAIPDPLHDHSLEYSGKMNSGNTNLFFSTTTQGGGSLTDGGTLYRE